MLNEAPVRATALATGSVLQDKDAVGDTDGAKGSSGPHNGNDDEFLLFGGSFCDIAPRPCSSKRLKPTSDEDETAMADTDGADGNPEESRLGCPCDAPRLEDYLAAAADDDSGSLPSDGSFDEEAAMLPSPFGQLRPSPQLQAPNQGLKRKYREDEDEDENMMAATSSLPFPFPSHGTPITALPFPLTAHTAPIASLPFPFPPPSQGPSSSAPTSSSTPSTFIPLGVRPPSPPPSRRPRRLGEGLKRREHTEINDVWFARAMRGESWRKRQRLLEDEHGEKDEQGEAEAEAEAEGSAGAGAQT